MKKTFFFIFLLVCALQSKAQTIPDSMYVPFPKDSAQWSVAKFNSTVWQSFQYKLMGDTLVNDKTYSKLYTSKTLYYSSPDRVLRCLLREDSSRKVWVKYVPQSGVKDTNEFVLYDFNVKVNDTLHLRLLNEIEDTVVRFMVTHIDIDPGFQQYPVYSIGLAPADGMIWGQACDNWSWNTGGVCATRGLLYNELAYLECFDKSVYVNLQCYWQGGVYYMGGNFCDYVGINNAKGQNNGVQFYYDIERNEYHISTEKPFLIAELYSVTGQLVHRKSLSNNEAWKINNSTTPTPGFYILKATLSNNQSYSYKLIIY